MIRVGSLTASIEPAALVQPVIEVNEEKGDHHSEPYLGQIVIANRPAKAPSHSVYGENDK